MTRLSLLTTLILCLLFAMPAIAQDAASTAEPIAIEAPAVGGDINVADGGTVNIQQPEPAPEPEPAPDRTGDLLQLAGTIIIALAGGGGILMIIDRLTRSKEAADNAEKLFQGLSPEWQQLIRDVVAAANQANQTAARILDFAERATDGLPNEPPPNP